VSDKTNAIAAVEGGYAELQAAAKGIPEGRATAAAFGEWSAKDVLAHMASWDEFTSLDMQRIARGHVPCLAAFKEAEVDQWNAFLMRPRRMFPLAQVQFESAHCHRQLLSALEALPEASFAPGVVANVLAVIAGHYRHHAGQIREWRTREGI
jgi:hypothetical protein